LFIENKEAAKASNELSQSIYAGREFPLENGNLDRFLKFKYRFYSLTIDIMDLAVCEFCDKRDVKNISL